MHIPLKGRTVAHTGVVYNYAHPCTRIHVHSYTCSRTYTHTHAYSHAQYPNAGTCAECAMAWRAKSRRMRMCAFLRVPDYARATALTERTCMAICTPAICTPAMFMAVAVQACVVPVCKSGMHFGVATLLSVESPPPGVRVYVHRGG